MHPSRRRPTPQLKGCDRAMELGRMDSILAEAELRCPEVQEVTPLHLLFITRKQDATYKCTSISNRREEVASI